MNKEERRIKFLKEHPQFIEWQDGSIVKFWGKIKKLKRKGRTGLYFKDIPRTIKIQTRKITSLKIKNGSLTRMPCEVCKNKKSVAHHEDYSNPLKVKWLCQKHHLDRHCELDNKIKDYYTIT